MSSPDCPRGPEEHKAAARELIIREDGQRPRAPGAVQLLVLTYDNDPFYCGTPAHRAQAEWFAGLWAEHGRVGTHLRHIHYRAFTAGSLLLDGTRYRNDEPTWKALQQAAAYARYLGLVNPERLSDQRNDRPVIRVDPRESEPEPEADLDGGPIWPELPSITAVAHAAFPSTGWVSTETSDTGRTLELPGVMVDGYDYDPADQPVLLEVWSEKSSVDDATILLRRELNLNYVPGTGYLSVMRIIELLRRAEAHDKPAHVLYISDYDKAGLNMPRQVARQVQFWRGTLGIDAEITLHPVALTADQVRDYGLPQQPDDPEKVELDALIALHPGALEQIIREAVAEWRDPDIGDVLSETESEAQEAADDQWADATADVVAAVEAIQAEAAEVVSRHRERLDEIRRQVTRAAEPFRSRLAEVTREINAATEPYRQQVEVIQAEADAELTALRDRLAGERDRYEEIVVGYDPELPSRPESECTAGHDGLLYDSRRDWLDQLNVFRASKGLPPVLDSSSEGPGAVPWEQVYDSLTSGNGPDGIDDLTNADRGKLIAALAAAGHLPAQIVTMTGINRSTVADFCPKGHGAQAELTCGHCGATFTGRSNAKYCSRSCGRAARGD
jgi:hypothetical protein